MGGRLFELVSEYDYELCLNFRDFESLTLSLPAPDMQTALQLAGRVGSGSSGSSSMGAGQSSVQQVLEILKKRQPIEAGKHLISCWKISVLKT